jgi:hypothetical protein
MTTWTRACGTNACIEVRRATGRREDMVAIRAAATDTIFATAEEWWQFLDDVKAGAFNDVIPREQP